MAISNAKLAAEARARDLILEDTAVEMNGLVRSEEAMRAEATEAKRKLRTEKEAVATLKVHARALEIALKGRHIEGVRAGGFTESEIKKAQNATEAASSLRKNSARDQKALQKFRKARKFFFRGERREEEKLAASSI